MMTKLHSKALDRRSLTQPADKIDSKELLENVNLIKKFFLWMEKYVATTVLDGWVGRE